MKCSIRFIFIIHSHQSDKVIKLINYKNDLILTHWPKWAAFKLKFSRIPAFIFKILSPMSVTAAASHRADVSVWVAFILLVIGTIGAYQIVGLNQALLFLIGGALGMTLYHASFGFTSSWRVFIKE